MKLACLLVLVAAAHAATDVRVDFTLNTTDPYGNPIQQQRYYYVYRPDGLSRTKPVPMVLVLEASANSGPATFFRDIAGKAGFVIVSCSFSGNTSGTPGTGWTADDPHISGWEDFDYFDEVMRQVAASQNAGDAFMTGISKAGHMTQAYACERPQKLRATGPLDEFMGLTSNIPTAPVPLIMFQGTLDTNVPYTMVKETVDVWRAVDSLLSVTPVTTYESSPLIPGSVTRATWRPAGGRPEIAMVTIVGGTHTYPTPSVQTGFDYQTHVWNFFARYLSDNTGAPRIVSRPVDNVQPAGMSASFHVTALGDEPLQYQWQRDGVDIPGATNDWYTLPAVADTDNGATFRAIVTNASGTATSDLSKLKVLPASVVDAPLDQTVVAGQPVHFSTAASGSKYQWRKNGVNIAGATGSALDIPAAVTADSGATFRVVVDGVTSSAATLTVTQAPGAPVILVNPARVRTMPGQGGTFSVTAWSLTPMSYQWQKGGFTTTMVDIPGANDSTYTVPPPTLADHLTMFRCIVTNDAGNAISASEMLFVTATPVKPSQVVSPLKAAVQIGAPFQYTISQSGGTAPLLYTAAALPDGLTLDPATGIISGTPTTIADTQVTIGASNPTGAVSEVLTISVTADPPVIPLETRRRATFLASATDPTIAGDTADPDADGFTNLQEFQSATNPLDPTSSPPSPAASQPRRGERN
jgi:poly(3-hydroxybutyrate) depolymerase